MPQFSPYEYQGAEGASMNDVIRNGGDHVKSLGRMPQSNQVNIDVLTRKRQWEQDKRGTLISADAS
jgi:hypothetical protein